MEFKFDDTLAKELQDYFTTKYLEKKNAKYINSDELTDLFVSNIIKQNSFDVLYANDKAYSITWNFYNMVKYRYAHKSYQDIVSHVRLYETERLNDFVNNLKTKFGFQRVEYHLGDATDNTLTFSAYF